MDVSQVKVTVTATDTTSGAFTSAKRNAIDFERQITQMSGSILSNIKSLGPAIAAGFSMREMLVASDSLTRIQGRLRNVTDSQFQYNQAMQDVQRIAAASQSPLEGVATLYARSSRALDAMGVSQRQIALLSENVALALRAEGAAGSEASSVLIQLSQALASGVLRGDEFNSIAENAPLLQRALADSLGVTIGQLRAMAEAGELTSDKLVKAFANESLNNALRVQAGNMETAASAQSALSNNFTLFVGNLAQKSGIIDLYSSGIKALSVALKEANRLIMEGRVSLEDYLPAYEQFRQKMDGEAKKAWSPTAKAGTAITQDEFAGLSLGSYGNSSIKLVTEAEEASKKLAKTKLSGIEITAKEIAQLEQVNKLISQGTSVEDARTMARMKSQGATDSQIRTYLALTNSVNQAVESERAIADAKKLVEEAAVNQTNANQQYISSIYEQINAAEVELANYGKLPSEITNATLAELERAKAISFSIGLTEKNVELIQQQIDLYKRLYDTQKGKEDIQAAENAKKQFEADQKAVKQAIDAADKEARQKYEETSRFLSRTITDGLMRGFENGKSFAENFKDTLINIFKSLVLEPVIRLVVDQSQITGVMQTVTDYFKTGGSSSLVASPNSNVIDRITNGFKSINTTFTSSIENLGVFLSNGQGGLGDKIGGFLGQYSGQIADGIGYLGAAYMLSQGNVVGAGLTAVGTYFGGPIGGAIGSAIGGLFGKKKRTPRYSAGVSTSYADGEFASTNLYGLSGFNKDAGGREGLSAAAKVFSETLTGLLGAYDINSSINTQLEFYRRKGAWGKGSIMVDGVAAAGVGGGSTSSVYSKDAQTAFNNLISEFLSTGIVNAIKVSKLPEGIKGLFDDLTDQTQIGNMINASVSLASAQDALSSTYNLNADLAGKVATASGLAGDSLIAFVNSLTAASLSQQSAASVLLKERGALTDLTGAVPTTLKAFDEWLKSINTTTAEGQAKFAEMFGARDRVSSLTSAFDAITTARDNALYGLLSQSEQMAISQAKLRDAFAEVNAEVPGSRDELVKWVNGLDLTMEAGLKAAMAVPALVDAFQQIEDQANSTANALRDMSGFTSLADYRFYKGVANNNGNQVANDYARASGAIQTNSSGKSTINGADVDVLAELKAMRLATQQQASDLNRILRMGLKVQA